MKNKPAIIIASIVGLGIVLYGTFFGYDFVKKTMLSNQRNDITFLADWEDMSTQHSQERGIFEYNWNTDTVIKLADEAAGKDRLVSKATLLNDEEEEFLALAGGLFTVSSYGDAQILLEKPEVVALIREYEKQHEQPNPDKPFLKEREDGFPDSFKRASDIQAYRDGFLIDDLGVLYYFEPDGETFKLSSFDKLPLFDAYYLVGKNHDKILAIKTVDWTRLHHEEGMPEFWAGYHLQKDMYLYDIETSEVEKIGSTQCPIETFCTNEKGDKFAFFDFTGSEFPILKIYNVDENELVKKISRIKDVSAKEWMGTGLFKAEFMFLLDTDEVILKRTDIDIGSSLAHGYDTSVVIVSENGQQKLPRKLQKFYIKDIVQ